MSNQGWIKLHRKILDNPIFGSEKGLKIWIWCLLRANHKGECAYIGRNKVCVETGSFIFGREKASDKLGIAKSTVRDWMKFLEDEGFIDIKPTTKYSIVYIKNWKEYQDTDNKSKTNRKQIDTNKNDKNEKKYNSEQSSQVNQVFDVFYNSINPTINYGNKTSRKAVDWMIKKWGIEATMRIAEYACEVHGQKYAPTITTPFQLKEKISNLKAYKEKNNSSSVRSL